MANEVVHTEHLVDEPQTFYEVFQLNRFGNVLPVNVPNEDAEDAVDKLLSKLTAHYEKQMDDHWAY